MIFRRIIDGAGGDDGALARHQPRHRTKRAHRARIGHRNGGAFEILDREFVVARSKDDVVEGLDELREVHRAGVLDVRHFQGSRTVLARNVHRDADVHGVAHHAKRLAIGFRVRVIQGRIGGKRLHDRPGDDVRVGDLALADQRAVFVENAAILVNHLDWHHALRRRQRDAEAGVHVLGDASRRTAQRHKRFTSYRLMLGNGRQRRRRRLIVGAVFRSSGAIPRSCGAVGLEDFLPAFVDRLAIVQILLIQLVFEPTVDT